MTSEKLDSAIQYIKSGNKQAALPILKEVLQANPADENAWLWLYACVDKVTEKKFCLQKALEINPGNHQARAALEKLTNPVSQPAEQASHPQTTTPAKTTKNSYNQVRIFGLGVVFLFAICAITSLLYLFSSGRVAALPAGLAFLASATFTPSITPTASITATPSPSLTATMTATRRPSATLIPGLASPTSPPTAAAFTPGNPTATPLGRDIDDVNFEKGLEAYQAKNYESAIALMSAVIDANPNLAPPYRYRAIANFYLNRCQDGMPDIEKALTLDPNYASAWAGRGTLEICLGNHRQAIIDFQKALSLDGSLAVAYENMGVAHYKLHNYSKAFEAYDMAVTIDPNRATAWSNRSEALARLHRYEECIESSNKALEINPQDWQAYTDRADCKMGQYRYKDAIEDLTIYFKSPAASAEVNTFFNHSTHYRRGNAYYSLGDYAHAFEDYQAAEPSYTGDARFYCQFAYAAIEIKRYKATLDAAEKSIAINPACGGARLLVVAARAAFGLGDTKAAFAYLDRARGWYTPYPLTSYYRGVFLQATGSNAAAADSFKEFLTIGYGGPETEDAQKRLAQLEPF